MNTSPVISLIFVNYRSTRYLQAALESLFSFEKEAGLFEIIVVNNDPEESALLQTLKAKYNFSFIESAENGGFGRGNNLGVRQAHGTILGFINPDVLWTGTHLRGIVDFFEGNAQVGILGMALLDEDGKPEDWSIGKEPGLVELFLNNLFLTQQTVTPKRDFFFSDWVSGGALFIRKELFTEVGGFDERFFLYFEDADLCKEIRKRGFSVVCHARFSLIHLGSKSRESKRLQKKHFFLSQREYFRKHRPRWESRILECLQFVFRKV